MRNGCHGGGISPEKDFGPECADFTRRTARRKQLSSAYQFAERNMARCRFASLPCRHEFRNATRYVSLFRLAKNFSESRVISPYPSAPEAKPASRRCRTEWRRPRYCVAVISIREHWHRTCVTLPRLPSLPATCSASVPACVGGVSQWLVSMIRPPRLRRSGKRVRSKGHNRGVVSRSTRAQIRDLKCCTLGAKVVYWAMCRGVKLWHAAAASWGARANVREVLTTCAALVPPRVRTCVRTARVQP